MASIEEKVESLVEPTINELGYEIYDVEYAKEGKDFFLRIFIDKEDGIDLEDCEKISNAITGILDQADYIKEAYFLEVSSPGVERHLRKRKHFEENIGKEIEVRLFKPIESEKIHIGILESFNQDSIIIEKEKGQLELPRKNIALVKTVYYWGE